jgi:hypothetical protein
MPYIDIYICRPNFSPHRLTLICLPRQFLFSLIPNASQPQHSGIEDSHALSALIDQHPAGLPRSELADCFFEADACIDNLLGQRPQVLLARVNSEKRQEIIFPFKPQSAPSFDAELLCLWSELQLPVDGMCIVHTHSQMLSFNFVPTHRRKLDFCHCSLFCSRSDVELDRELLRFGASSADQLEQAHKIKARSRLPAARRSAPSTDSDDSRSGKFRRYQQKLTNVHLLPQCQ